VTYPLRLFLSFFFSHFFLHFTRAQIEHGVFQRCSPSRVKMNAQKPRALDRCAPLNARQTVAAFRKKKCCYWGKKWKTKQTTPDLNYSSQHEYLHGD